MKKIVVFLAVCLLASQAAHADYILASGSNDTGANGGQSVIRYTDDFEVVWERSPALGTAETPVFVIAVSPINGDVYTGNAAGPQLGKHLSYVDGSYIGRPIPQPGQTDGTGTYTVPGEALQDIKFGHDYNQDGVPDLWVLRRNVFEVYDGATLDRAGDDGTADILTSLSIPDSAGGSGVQDGTGGFGFCFGPDVTGDGVGELYVLAGINAGTNSRLNVWDPVTMTQFASYNADGTRDNTQMIMGPDVNGDGRKDLWVTDPRSNRIRAFDYTNGAIVADPITLVSADDEITAVTLRFPTDIDAGPEGTLVITTRFASSPDADWAGGSEVAGGDLLQLQWDAASTTCRVRLLFEYPQRLDHVQHIGSERQNASNPNPVVGVMDVPRDVVLSWTPGEFAATHDVYFGKDPQAVEDATTTNPLGVLAAQGQGASTFDPDGLLDFSQTYYWRVDEVNAAPDNTVFTGDVWSFTAEAFSSPISNVTATASIPTSAGAGDPVKTVDGSGLDNRQHGIADADMWLGDASAGGPAWIQYEFDSAYKLYDMRVWNYNIQLEAYVGFGVKDVTIDYSADGSDWMTLGDFELARAPGMADYAGMAVDLDGIRAKFVRLTINSSWGGLTKFGLSEVQFSHIAVHAREPQPAAGATDVEPDVVLSWRAGREAASHQIYFGGDEQAVIDGTALVDTVTRKTYDVGSLNLGTTYYWRIAEVNEAATPSVWESDVWSFSTKESVTIDDMESYTDDEHNRLFDVWIDGYDVTSNGSLVGHENMPYAEKTIRHGGKQSMPFYYDNTVGVANSEIERTFDTAQNWTANGADTLSLYIRGEPVAFLETEPGTIRMSGVGLDIYQQTDEFRYAYKQLTGNGSITARIDSIQNTHDWAKVGVMIRAALEVGAMQAHMIGTPNGRVEWMPRLTTLADAAGTATAVGAAPMPQWVRITREGNTFTGEYSADGQTWTAVLNTTPATIEMPNTVYIGLVVSSHLSDVACGAQFSSVSTTGTVAGEWQLAAVGADQPAGNGIDTLYVTVEDSSGHSKTVANPDPYAVVSGEWQQWKIPLSDLTAAGVRADNVRKIYLGVGDRTQPSRNAAGVLYIDDIAYGHPLAVE